METRSNRLYAEMPPVKLFFHAAIPGVVSMFLSPEVLRRDSSPYEAKPGSRQLQGLPSDS